MLNFWIESMYQCVWGFYCHLSRQRYAFKESPFNLTCQVMPHLTWNAFSFHDHSPPNLFIWKYISVCVGLHCHLSCGMPLLSENPCPFRIPCVPCLRYNAFRVHKHKFYLRFSHLNEIRVSGRILESFWWASEKFGWVAGEGSGDITRRSSPAPHFHFCDGCGPCAVQRNNCAHWLVRG